MAEEEPLERVTQRELDLAVGALRGGNRAHAADADCGGGKAELRVVERIKEFGAQFEAAGLGESELLRGR